MLFGVVEVVVLVDSDVIIFIQVELGKLESYEEFEKFFMLFEKREFFVLIEDLMVIY